MGAGTRLPRSPLSGAWEGYLSIRESVLKESSTCAQRPAQGVYGERVRKETAVQFIGKNEASAFQCVTSVDLEAAATTKNEGI